MKTGSLTKNYAYYTNTNKVKNTDGAGNDYVYDATGNMSQSVPKNINQLSYDKHIQMTKSITMVNNDKMFFTYDGTERRVLKKDKSNNQLYLYDGLNPIIENMNARQNKEYVYGPTGVIAIKTDGQINWIIKDHLGSTRVVANMDNTVLASMDYAPYGSVIRYSGNSPMGYAFTGQEYDSTTGMWNFKARMYDSELGIFYARDPMGQGASPFAYCGNGPTMRVDKDGKFWFVPILIGAAIGGYSGYKIGKAEGAKGLEMFGYIAGGAAIGGAAGGASLGVSALGGSAWTAGAVGGAVGGAGFSGLSSGGDLKEMGRGALYGGLSGLAGGYVGSAIGGGWGAFAGGAVGSGLNTALNGGNPRQIASSMITGGALSYGTYEATSYINWKWGGGNQLGPHNISYTQYKTIQADFQRSAFYGKEYGGWLMNDGSVLRVPADWRYSHGISGNASPEMQQMASRSFAFYHTHWDYAGKEIYTNDFGQEVTNGYATALTTTRHHGPADFLSIDSYVINRYQQTSFSGGTEAYRISQTYNVFNDSFFRYYPWYILK